MSSNSSTSLTPAAAHILRTLCAAKCPVRASELFACLAVAPSVGSAELGLDALAVQAQQMDHLGLVLHLRSRSGLLYLSPTNLGRLRFSRIEHVRSRRHAVSRASLIVGVAIPMLASCAALAPQEMGASVQQLQPVPPSRTAQVEFHGRLVWSVCQSDDACPGPTPKTRTVLIPSSPAALPAVIAPPPLAPPPPAAPRFDAFSLFYPAGDAYVSRAERPHFELALQAIRDSRSQESVRIFVVGMTDLSGSASFNAALAHRRAERIRSLLEAAGVDAGRVSTQIDTSATRAVPSQSSHRNIPSDPTSRFRRVDIVLSTKPIDGLRPSVASAPEASVRRKSQEPASARSASPAVAPSGSPTASLLLPPAKASQSLHEPRPSSATPFNPRDAR